MIELLYIFALIALIIASFSDIKTREVPDWLSYSLIFFAFGSRAIYALIEKDVSYFLYGLYGFLFFLVIGLVMYYGGQWGGGDSKMLIALGALLGFSLRYDDFIVSFFINIIIIGGIYGLLFSIFLAFKNRKKFLKKFREFRLKNKKIEIVFVFLSLILILSSLFIKEEFVKFTLLIFAVMILFIFYIWGFIKKVEEVSMFRYVKPDALTEGDWIVKDIVIDGKHIVGPRDLGISKKQIKQLVGYYKKGKIKRVQIKVGIPFIPSFFLAFIISYFFGNILFLLF